VAGPDRIIFWGGLRDLGFGRQASVKSAKDSDLGILCTLHVMGS